MINDNYDSLCKKINLEYKKIKNPKFDDLSKLSKKFNTDLSIIRECIGLKDYYDFVIDVSIDKKSLKTKK